MTYLELYALGEQMIERWNNYCSTGTTEARMSYFAACTEYEEAERECDALPIGHEAGCNVVGEQA